nr:cation-transporting P-type ATPase [Clostridia bacterium]
MEINIPKTDPTTGLDDSEAVRSRKLYGTNEITRRKTNGFVKQFISNLGDPMIKILLGALALNLLLSAGSGNLFESIGIASAVLLSTLVSTVSEYGSSLAFAKLSEEASNVNCRVRRNGEVTYVPINDIVVGDTVLLGAGEMIPSDGILVSGKLTTDQSSLTGESAECEKVPSIRQNDTLIWDTSDKTQLFRGSTVTAGEGIMLTHRVGGQTFLGGMAQELQEDTPDSPLKLRLARLARQISVIGYCAAILVAAADLANLLFMDGGLYTLTLQGFISHLLHAVTLGLTVVVVAVPEGLPMMITVVLSSNMLRMKRGNVMVRKLVGIETAGSVNILFCDKTGTLTEGELSVSEFCTPDGSRCEKLSDIPMGLREITALSCVMNNSSEFDKNKKPSGGNSTDRAVLGFAGYDSISICKKYSKTAYRPFDSTSKYSSAVIKGPHNLTLIKGAPEKILPNCTAYLTSDGKTVHLDRHHREQLTDMLRRYTESACRVIALAVSQSETTGTLKNLTFAGFP